MERSTIVRVHEGLHARPATRFVKLAKSFESDVEILKGGKAVSAKSPVKLMLLAVKENDEVTVRADGADAIEAVEALIGYLENPRSGLEEDGSAGVPAGRVAPPAAVLFHEARAAARVAARRQRRGAEQHLDAVSCIDGEQTEAKQATQVAEARVALTALATGRKPRR